MHAIATILPFRPITSIESLQQQFLSILPRIEKHARLYFRYLRTNPDKFADVIAETVALAWARYVRLMRRGKDLASFVSTFARRCAQAVRYGRRLCGTEKPKDAMSLVCQQRHNFAVGKLCDCDTLSTNPLTDALVDNTITPVPEQVVFRVDFPAWLRRLDARHRQVIDDMMQGEGTYKLAAKYGYSSTHICWLRNRFKQEWDRFGERSAKEEPQMAA